jgi:carbon monoxide dehydrogenase subunit G
MASIRKEILTRAAADAVWDAVRDVGALHTRLVPGFVSDTRMEGSTRIVTFTGGTVLREPIVSLDDAARRLVWTAEGGLASHYNAAVQVSQQAGGGTRVVWTADFLPDAVAAAIDAAMTAGAAAMQRALDELADPP